MMNIDRDTALAILKEFSRDMYPSYDLFGKKTLVIDRDKFEAIRSKYLDQNKSLVQVMHDRFGYELRDYFCEVKL